MGDSLSTGLEKIERIGSELLGIGLTGIGFHNVILVFPDCAPGVHQFGGSSVRQTPNLGAQGTFAPTVGLRRVTLDYTFANFDDGGNVGLTASVDGTEVYSGSPFTWDNNGGELYFEIGTLENTRLDNVTISTIPEPSASLLALVGAAGVMLRRRRSVK